MRNSLTKIAVAAVASTLFSTAVLATETRVETLRFNGGVEDETRVFTYPGQISKYKLALVELGTSDSREAYGAAFADTGSFRVGAALSRTSWLFSGDMMETSSFKGKNLSLFDLYEAAMQDSASKKDIFLYAPARPIELLMGFGVGGGTLGLRLAMADYKNQVKSTTTGVTNEVKYGSQHVQMGVGFHTKVPGSLDVALTIDVIENQKRTETSSTLDSSTSIKGGNSNMSIDGRWVANETASGPYVEASLKSRNFKASGTSGGRDFSGKFSDSVNSIEGGYVAVGGNSSKLYTGVELLKSTSKGPTITTAAVGSKAIPSYLANDEQAKLDALVVSGTLGGEADIVGGFGMMAGMHYVMYGDMTATDNTTNKDAKATVSFPETSDSTLWALGAYYKAAALRLDASYSKQFLYNGPYLISGNQTSPMLAKISASYTF